MATPLINGEQHSWASIKVVLFNKTVTGITGINYDRETAMDNLYGAGDEPVARGRGNRSYKGDITLYQYEVVALQQAAGTDLDNIPPFDIVVHYAATASAPAVTDIIQNCQFKTNGRPWKQGDTKTEIKLDLVIAGIKFQTT